VSADTASWQAANQAALLAALRPVYAALLRHAGLPNRAVTEELALPALDPPATIDRLTELFGLTSFERAVLLLCAGVELESRFGEACAAAQREPRDGRASFGLALAALDDAHWSALSRDRPLRRMRLVELLPGGTLTSAPLRIDERVLHFLAGVDSSDERLDGVIAPMSEAALATPTARIAEVVARAARALAAPGRRVLLTGPTAGDRELAAAVSLRRSGLWPYVLHAADIPAAVGERIALARAWSREARLAQAGLCVQLAEGVEARPLLSLLSQIDVPLVVEGDEAAVPAGLAAPRIALTPTSAAERRTLWADSVGPRAARIDGALDAVADQFNLDTMAIRAAAASLALEEPIAEESGLACAAWRVGRVQARRSLEQLARRIEPKADWDSLVLPDLQMRTLQLIAVHARNRVTVLERWGFAGRYSRGLGLTALFSGPSGTGKTMAAEVLAHTLDLDLFQIDLAEMVSKYIGETEKNLRRVFDAAEAGGAILLFDEADALFGKRSEVKDSHDRYANLEISYLLQRMEAYRGLAILTTNMRHAIDPSFLRRLRFVVEFPFPGAAERARIWQRVLPAETPRAELDPVRLAQLGIPGGIIRNIAMHAAFLAADAAEPVGIAHMLAATRIEYAKLERPLGRAEIEGWG